MSKGDFIKLDETTELMKISADKYRYNNPLFTKPTAKISDFNADIKLKVGNEYFKVHKAVLSEASVYFSAMFSHDMLEKDKDYIELKGISVGGFQVMLEYFYHGHITLVLDNVQHCLEASTFFHVEWLTKVCCDFMKRHLSVENCLQIIDLADAYHLTDLLDEMYCFIGLHASTLLDSGKLQQLSYQTLLQLLSADYYIDLPEELVLGLVVDWVNEDFQSRECDLEQLLMHIKFHLFLPEQLENIPKDLLNIGNTKQRVDNSKLLWDKPHNWSVLSTEISGRGGRNSLVLLSDWTMDKMHMIDLNNPYLHEEPLGLLEFDSLSDFVTLSTLNGFLYCLGGYDTHLKAQNSVLMYDPRLKIWIELSPMKHCRQSFPVVTMDRKLYALGGATLLPADEESGDDTLASLSQCECYDPETDSWSCIPPLPYGLTSHQACVLDGTIYVTGGVCEDRSEPVPIGYTYCWTPGDQVWTRKAPMLYRRQCHAMFTHQGNIYVIGGYTAGDLEDLSLGITSCLKNECYDPETDSWVELADTPKDFGEIGQAMAIMDGVAYFLGGSVGHRCLHEFHLDSGKFVEGAFCGKNLIQLTKLKAYYPKHVPSDASKLETNYNLSVGVDEKLHTIGSQLEVTE